MKTDNLPSVNLPTAATTKAVTAFIDYKFGHPIARHTFKQLCTEMSIVSSPQILLLVGPTGVGKSTLIRAACNRVMSNLQGVLQTEPDFVPIVSLSAMPSTGAAFDWKDFYIRLLLGQNEPLTDRKLFLPRQPVLFPDAPVIDRVVEQSAAPALRRSVESHLKHRRTRLLVIDEAQDMLLSSGASSKRNFELIKSMAVNTGTTILMTGTYDLLSILEQSGQLARRSQIIEFPRYDMRLKEQREEFRKILFNLSTLLAQHVPVKIMPNAEFFYIKSIGCIGILKDWLARCLEHALMERVSCIDAKFAERFALDNKSLKRILEEALWGEQKLEDTADNVIIEMLQSGTVLTKSGYQGAQPKPRRPGTRKPTRDPVGGARP